MVATAELSEELFPGKGFLLVDLLSPASSGFRLRAADSAPRGRRFPPCVPVRSFCIVWLTSFETPQTHSSPVGAVMTIRTDRSSDSSVALGAFSAAVEEPAGRGSSGCRYGSGSRYVRGACGPLVELMLEGLVTAGCAAGRCMVVVAETDCAFNALLLWYAAKRPGAVQRLLSCVSG